MPGFLHNTYAVLRRELVRLTHQPMYFVLMLVLPVVSFAFFALLFNKGVARDIPIAVLDEDHTSLSRKVTQMIDATPTALVAYEIQDMNEGERLMREGKVMAIVQIPSFFEKRILSNSQTHIENYVSGTNITVNGLLSKDIQTAVTTFTAGIQLQLLTKQGLSEKQAMAQLREAGHEVVEQFYAPEELGAALREFDAVVVRSKTKVRANHIDEAKGGKLKLIIRGGVGVDNIDVKYAEANGITVKNTPKASSQSVAELAMGHMFSCARYLSIAGPTMREGKWEKKAYGKGIELQGKTLGIHAYGNVGRLVGRKGKALGMNVVAYDPFIADGAVFEADGVKKVASVEELYRVSDFLSLHIPATAQTKGSIGYDLMMSMPKGATLVNTARKEVIDEEGVVRAMTEREDLKYITDIAPDAQAEMAGKFGKRFFATAKKMGAETAEANLNAGLAAARQTVDFLKNGNRRFQVNK